MDSPPKVCVCCTTYGPCRPSVGLDCDGGWSRTPGPPAPALVALPLPATAGGVAGTARPAQARAAASSASVGCGGSFGHSILLAAVVTSGNGAGGAAARAPDASSVLAAPNKLTSALATSRWPPPDRGVRIPHPPAAPAMRAFAPIRDAAPDAALARGSTAAGGPADDAG